MAVQVIPVWDGRQPWDGKPIAVNVEDWSEFCRVNHVRAARQFDPDGGNDWTMEVVDADTESVPADRESYSTEGRREAPVQTRTVGGRNGRGRKGAEETYQASLWDGIEAD